jgi:hypothetical protein
MHGHLPGKCRGQSGAPPCSLAALNRSALAAATRVLSDAEVTPRALDDRPCIL